MEHYFEDESFGPKDTLELPAEYENCTFENISFESLNACVLVDCTFINCDLSNTPVIDTTFNGVDFVQCKMIGLRFDSSNAMLFTVSFSACNLNLASFYQRNIQGTRFQSCNLTETEFIEADCTNVVFDFCNLQGAKFEQSTLIKTNFYSSEGLSIDPEINRFSKCIFSTQNALGLLSKYDIELKP
jgi:uncharacterized protein YjbI with pentapeptide repeats